MVRRFSSKDQYGIASCVANPQKWGRYAYATNDAINKTDPLGLDCWLDDSVEGGFFERNGGDTLLPVDDSVFCTGGGAGQKQGPGAYYPVKPSKQCQDCKRQEENNCQVDNSTCVNNANGEVDLAIANCKNIDDSRRREECLAYAEQARTEKLAACKSSLKTCRRRIAQRCKSVCG